MQNQEKTINIKLAHSPDPDDAFMFWALAKNKFDYAPYHFEHILSDIQTLNEKALNAEYEVTAISFYAYPWLADRYALLPSGSSMGLNYGPMVVCKKENLSKKLSDLKLVIPGKKTSAFLTLQLYEPNLKIDQIEVQPFDQIINLVEEGRYDAGLIIHEGQLTYEEQGLALYVDLGKWWYDCHQLPLPLGGNVVKKDLGVKVMQDLSRILRESIRLGLENRAEAVKYALQFGRDLNLKMADDFIGMYVNDLTLDYGESGRAALKKFFDMAQKAGLIPSFKIDWVE